MFQIRPIGGLLRNGFCNEGRERARDLGKGLNYHVLRRKRTRKARGEGMGGGLFEEINGDTKNSSS